MTVKEAREDLEKEIAQWMFHYDTKSKKLIDLSKSKDAQECWNKVTTLLEVAKKEFYATTPYSRKPLNDL